MSSQQYKLEKLVAAKAAGKRAVVKVNGVPYAFGGVLWGGTSPRISLIDPAGVSAWHSAAEWKKRGAAL